MIDSPLSSVLSEDCEEEEIWEKEDGDEGGATELEDGDCEELEDKHQDEDDPVIQEDEENFANAFFGGGGVEGGQFSGIPMGLQVPDMLTRPGSALSEEGSLSLHAGHPQQQRGHEGGAVGRQQPNEGGQRRPSPQGRDNVLPDPAHMSRKLSFREHKLLKKARASNVPAPIRSRGTNDVGSISARIGGKVVDFSLASDVQRAESGGSEAGVEGQGGKEKKEKKKGAGERGDSALRYKLTSGGSYNCVRMALKRAGFKPTKGEAYNVHWGRPYKMPDYAEMDVLQKTNHFPGAFLLGRKDNMARACARFRRIFGPEAFPYFPKTWILPTDRADLMSDWEVRRDAGQLYIYKPPSGCKGIGIRIITDPATQIKAQSNAVVSHYIDDPFLVNGLKFDMRIYVLITCFQPLRVYIHEQGLVRFCTSKYEGSAKKTRKNRYRHLTNYSLNKNSKNFVKNEDDARDDVGHKWSLRAFKQWMVDNGHHSWEKVNEEMEDLIVKTLLAVEVPINTNMQLHVPSRSNCFQLLGFDVMLDSHLKPWLIEVNTAPSLATDSPMDKKIKAAVVTDTLHLIMVRAYDRRRLEVALEREKQARLHGEKPSGRTNTENVRRREVCAGQRSALADMTEDDYEVLSECEGEFERIGGFIRTFPSPELDKTLRWSKFFETRRYYNLLVLEWAQKVAEEPGLTVAELYKRSREMKARVPSVVRPPPTHTAASMTSPSKAATPPDSPAARARQAGVTAGVGSSGPAAAQGGGRVEGGPAQAARPNGQHPQVGQQGGGDGRERTGSGWPGRGEAQARPGGALDAARQGGAGGMSKEAGLAKLLASKLQAVVQAGPSFRPPASPQGFRPQTDPHSPAPASPLLARESRDWSVAQLEGHPRNQGTVGLVVDESTLGGDESTLGGVHGVVGGAAWKAKLQRGGEGGGAGHPSTSASVLARLKQPSNEARPSPGPVYRKEAGSVTQPPGRNGVMERRRIILKGGGGEQEGAMAGSGKEPTSEELAVERLAAALAWMADHHQHGGPRSSQVPDLSVGGGRFADGQVTREWWLAAVKQRVNPLKLRVPPPQQQQQHGERPSTAGKGKLRGFDKDGASLASPLRAHRQASSPSLGVGGGGGGAPTFSRGGRGDATPREVEGKVVAVPAGAGGAERERQGLTAGHVLSMDGAV